MPTLAYLDTPSGISGDMFLGALLDAGWSIDGLRAVVAALGLPAAHWSVEAETVMRGPMRATRAQISAVEGDTQRHLQDIEALIGAARLPAPVMERAIRVFQRLAGAEARIHNTTPEKIHFHEVGALDAIIDIVGVVAGLHELDVEKLYASPLPLGPGWTLALHGRIPLPAPATLELLAVAGAPIVPAPGPGELVTPTGAALLAELATFRQPAMVLHTVGTGAGGKEFSWPNITRLWVGNPVEEGQMMRPWNYPAGESEENRDHVVVIQTNIDDMAPELYGAVSERLFAAGALDVWWTPIGMKKNRPGTELSVLAPVGHESLLADLLLRETTTLGVRVQTYRRHIAQREIQTVATRFGEARVKVKRLGDEVVGVAPEYEDCRTLAAAAGVPVRTIYEAVQAAGQKIVRGQKVKGNK